jgi:alcohol dehydrogenase (cytochrome c)
VFFGDLGGNFYARDAVNGRKLWNQELGGAITYTANGVQKVAVTSGAALRCSPGQRRS